MIVYGDPEHSALLSVLLRDLRERARPGCSWDLDELRVLLIQAGQLEQAVSDYCEAAGQPRAATAAQVERFTDCAARVFFAAWTEASNRRDSGSVAIGRQLEWLARELENAGWEEDPRLRVKLPEGFHFYALFPEQYCAATLQWAASRQGVRPGRALVVGIRSIGTTLSAVAKAALESLGWQAERMTVRPAGHPFHREVALKDQALRVHRSQAIIVDEGPGLSGSSMAATAEALAKAGCTDISFLPGHGNDPGAAASPKVRRWWSSAPRYVVPLGDLTWNGRSLTDSLLERAKGLGRQTARERTIASGSYRPQGLQDYAAAAAVERIRTRPKDLVQDLSGGQWRSRTYIHKADWPPVCAMFERSKYVVQASGCDTVLWKFSGLGGRCNRGRSTAKACYERLRALAEQGFVPKPLGVFRGFVASLWIEGRRLKLPDQSRAEVLNHLGRYLVRAAQPALSEDESIRAVERLAEVLYWNTHEAFGEELAEQTRQWVRAARQAGPGPSYGDGRMGPWEWIQTHHGGLLKSDSTGHELDHTIVGSQSLLWDVAGTLGEWGLEGNLRAGWLESLSRYGVQLEPEVLKFYELAYAAFRMGIVSLAANQTGDGEEQQRLNLAQQWYGRRLENLLRQN